MRTNFDHKLNDVHRELLDMGDLVKANISLTVDAFINHDVVLAKEVIKGDTEINGMHFKIDQACEQIIAMEQPNTTDLRRIIAILRASSNLERMGDHALNISEITIRIKDKERVEAFEVILNNMAQIIISMAKEILEAFVDFDVQKAKDTAKRDKKVDNLYKDLRKSSIDKMQMESTTIDVMNDYNFVGMHLERIGDYIKNISEGIIYLETGNVTDL